MAAEAKAAAEAVAKAKAEAEAKAAVERAAAEKGTNFTAFTRTRMQIQTLPKSCCW